MSGASEPTERVHAGTRGQGVCVSCDLQDNSEAAKGECQCATDLRRAGLQGVE
jgi:hypothetical protein